MGEALSARRFAGKRDYKKLNEPGTLCIARSPVDGLQEYKYPLTPHARLAVTLGVRWSVHVLSVGSTKLLQLEDTDHCWRIQLTGTELHFVPDAVVHHACAVRIRRLWESTMSSCIKIQTTRCPQLSWKEGVKAWWVC